MDWSRVINILMENAPLAGAILAAIGLLGFLALKYVLPPVLARALDAWGQQAIPAGVKSSLMNGSGELVRTIIKAENEAQTLAHVARIQEVVDRHQEVEQARDGERHRELLARLDVHEQRIRDLEAKRAPRRATRRTRAKRARAS